jgi:anthranilate synthase component 2
LILVLDNRDSFTFNLAQALQRLGAEVDVRRSSELDVAGLRALAPDALLIGPGPGRPEGAGCSLDAIRELAGELPILGVCLGHQAIAAAQGGRVAQAPELVHGRTVEVEHDGRGLFAGLPSPVAMTRYNSLTVVEADLPPALEVTARTPDGDVMGLRHRDHPLFGVQFHPESILSEHGERLLANFVALAR